MGLIRRGNNTGRATRLKPDLKQICFSDDGASENIATLGTKPAQHKHRLLRQFRSLFRRQPKHRQKFVQTVQLQDYPGVYTSTRIPSSSSEASKKVPKALLNRPPRKVSQIVLDGPNVDYKFLHEADGKQTFSLRRLQRAGNVGERDTPTHEIVPASKKPKRAFLDVSTVGGDDIALSIAAAGDSVHVEGAASKLPPYRAYRIDKHKTQEDARMSPSNCSFESQIAGFRQRARSSSARSRNGSAKSRPNLVVDLHQPYAERLIQMSVDRLNHDDKLFIQNKKPYIFRAEDFGFNHVVPLIFSTQSRRDACSRTLIKI